MKEKTIESTDSPYILAATAANFREFALENSDIGPVLLNFWSKKAGPCFRLYPVLDQVIHHYKGRVLLINIDTETEISITRQYGIASVPALKLLRHQKVVETLHGYHSKDELIKILEQYVARDSDLILAEAIKLYTDNKQAEAYEMIANAVVDDPLNPRLPLTVCKLLKHEKRYDEAISLIDTLPEHHRDNREIGQFYDVLFFCNEAKDVTDADALIEQLKQSPEDLPVMKQVIAHFAARQLYQQALQLLLVMMSVDREYDNGYARTAMLKIFNIIGPEHELIEQFRPELKRYAH